MKERLRLFFCRFIITTVFVVSALCTFGASNAFAANDIITGGAGSCTVDVLGVSDDNALVNTIATWELVSYNCAAGTYLVISETTIGCSDCPIGSYCPGGVFTVEDEYLGINACPDGYTTRTTKSTSESDCASFDGVPDYPTDTNSFYATTPLLSAGEVFKFDISAGGSFTIDWGDGTTETFDKAVGNETYSHTYTNADQYTIEISSQNVTGYSATDAAISFQCKDAMGDPLVDNPVVAFGGTLGGVFPTLANDVQPLFTKTFYGCDSINNKKMPDRLFVGLHGRGAPHMFDSTFYGWSMLQEISSDMFADISGTPSESMFAFTFANTGLKSIPDGLFGKISGATTNRLFQGTFQNTEITNIPDTLFAGINGDPTQPLGVYAFANTFERTGITSIPSGLFNSVRGTPSEGMFSNTFAYTKITSIPENLFGTISGDPAKSMFQRTFASTSITSIPKDLFVSIKGAPAESMFASTFESCKSLSGQIPGSLFANISGAPIYGMFMSTFKNSSGLSSWIPPELFRGIKTEGFITGQMADVVLGTGILEQCPVNMMQYITGFEADFDSKVSCAPCPANSTQDAGLNTYCNCGVGYTVGGVLNGTTVVGYGETCDAVVIRVTYSCGNSSVAPDSVSVAYNQDLTVASGTSCVKGGYDFTGWQVNGTDVIAQPDEILTWNDLVGFGQNINLVAVYEPGTFTITYNCDDGTLNDGATTTQTVTFGESFTTANSICAKANHAQTGWVAYSGETPFEYGLGQTATWNFWEDKTFTATYKPAYMITYSCGDGTGNAPESQGPILQDEEYVPQNNTCTAPAGYSFDGWSVSNTENIVQQPGQMYNYTFLEDKTFTAIWKPNCNKITLDATTNGGSGGTGVIYKKTGSGTAYSDDQCNVEISSVTTPLKLRASFTGYYTVAELSGGNQCITTDGAILSTDTCNVTAPTTWYARYDCDSDYVGSGVNISGRCTGQMYTVTYNCGAGTGTPPSSQSIEYGTSFSPRANTCTRAGFVFDGWRGTSGTTGTFTPGALYTYTYKTNITLTAQWKEYEINSSTDEALVIGVELNQDYPSDYQVVEIDICADGDFLIDWGYNQGMYEVRGIRYCDTYSHTYTRNGDRANYEIKIYGLATGYQNLSDKYGQLPNPVFKIRCDAAPHVRYISGSLAKIFPTLPGDIQPSFEGTFENCELNQGIDQGKLFKGLIGKPRAYMFANTFKNTQITGYIGGYDSNGGLFGHSAFGGENSTAPHLFEGTFYGTNISGVSTNLFANFKGKPKEAMFKDTFRDCLNLSIGSNQGNLFSAISGPAVPHLFSGTFANTPFGYTIPTGLFETIEGPTTSANHLFYETFMGSQIKTIPEDLFWRIETKPYTSIFHNTFYGCYNLTDIPGALFQSVQGDITGTDSAFSGTFNMAKDAEKKLENPNYMEIPPELFAGVTGEPAKNMFNGTFRGLNITEIPENLFAGISGAPAAGMFLGTFMETNITAIPGNLFAKIKGKPQASMFKLTFADTQITEIPSGLFSGISGAPAISMFQQTFENTPITEIPSGLFRGISGPPAESMFQQTFKNCNQIVKQIPENLFFGISGALAKNSFYETFYGIVNTSFATNDYNFIPPQLFSNITKGSATSDNQAMYNLFSSSNLRTACPATHKRVDTGFEEWFYYVDGKKSSIKKVACEKCPEHADQRENNDKVCECDTGYGPGKPGDTYSEWVGENGDNLKAGEICLPFRNALRFYCTEVKVGGDYFTKYGYYDQDFTWPSQTEYESQCGDLGGCKRLKYWRYWHDPEIKYYAGVTIPFDGIDEDNQTFFEPVFEYDYVSPNCDPTGTDWENPDGDGDDDWEFIIVTTPETSNFTIRIAADLIENTNNKFVIDWGDGKETTPNPWFKAGWIYKHDYDLPGTYVIKMKGDAKKYPDVDDNVLIKSVIGFDDSVKNIRRIYRSLGDVFPTLSDGTQPKFQNVFKDAENLEGPIPPYLFTGKKVVNNIYPVHGVPRESMFESAFENCPKLSGTIPAKLFSPVSMSMAGGSVTPGLTGSVAKRMFANTFKGCSGLTGKIPELFQAFSDQAESAFAGTFWDCSGLTEISSNLFGGDYWGDPYTGSTKQMFENTFNGCTGLNVNIPGSLFSRYNTPGEKMFSYTFYGCSGLTGGIPADLFANISGKAVLGMFDRTFHGCSGLTSIPAGLFSKISGTAPWLFNGTFQGCTSIPEIPSGLFSSIRGLQQPYMFKETFRGCTGINQPLPDSLFTGISGVGDDGTDYMFQYTFMGCENIPGTLPWNIFANIDTPGFAMFERTFDSCKSLDGPIPETLLINLFGPSQKWLFNGMFANCTSLDGPLPANLFKGGINGDGITGKPAENSFKEMFYNTKIGSNTAQTWIPWNFFSTLDNKRYTAGPMADIFLSSSLATECPENMYVYETGFESDFDGKVACKECPSGQYQDPDNRYQCKVLAYTLSYDCNGGTGTPPDSQAVKYNGKVTLRANSCTKTGYTFGGWYFDDNPSVALSAGAYYTYKYKSNKTLYAKWNNVVYTVELEDRHNTFTENGTAISMEPDVNVVPTPLYSSYQSPTWHTDKQLLSDSVIKTLTQLPKVNKYIFAGFTEEKYAASNATRIISHTGEILPKSFPYTKNTTLYAQYSQCKCNPGVGVETCEVIETNDNNECVYEIKCKNGYVVSNSIQTSALASFSPMCLPAKMLTITLDSDKYTKIDSDLGTIIGSRVPATVNATPETLYLKQGYGWYKDATGADAISALSVLPSITSTVGTEQEFNGFYTDKAGTGIQVIDKNGNLLVTEQVLNAFDENATIYADYITTIKTFNVSYSCGAGSGTPPESQSVSFKQKFTVAENTNCAIENKNFIDWQVSDSNTYLSPNQSVMYMYDTDITLTARYANQTYNVAYDKNNADATGDAPDSPYTCVVGEPCFAPDNTFVFIGHEFTGWTCSGATKCNEDGFIMPSGYDLNELNVADGDTITLFAQWAPAKFDIVYKSNGGTGNDPTLTYCAWNDTTCPAPENPYVRKGYDFDAWEYYINNTGDLGLAEPGFELHDLFSYNPSVVTLKAIWDPMQVNIRYDGNGGTTSISPIEPAHCSFGSSCVVPDNPYTKDGYIFTGWLCSGEKCADTTRLIATGESIHDLFSDNVADGDTITLVAQWAEKPAERFYIEYNSNDGTGSAPSEPTVCLFSDTECRAPENTFIRTGYKFAGWLCAGEDTECSGTIFNPADSLYGASVVDGATVYLIAQWTPITFTVSYNMNGGTPQFATQTCTYDEDCFIPDNSPSKFGYKFKYWCDIEDCPTMYMPGDNLRNFTGVDNAKIVMNANYDKIELDFDIEYYESDESSEPFYVQTCSLHEPCNAREAIERLGYKFNNWRCSGDVACNGEDIAAGADISNVSEDGSTVVLTGTWTPNKFNILYDGNGATELTEPLEPTECEYGQSCFAPDNAYVYDGYDFSHWVCTSDSGSCSSINIIEGENISTLTFVDGATVTLTAQWLRTPEFPFQVTTTPDTDEFAFTISATGTFYVDWGDGNKYSTITISDTDGKNISYRYSQPGEYVIRIGGAATGYNADDFNAAITFTNNKQVKYIDGSLGAVFGTLSDGTQPSFYSTFNGCDNLSGNIPSELFTGISGAGRPYMFGSTFANTGLDGAVPADLFAGLAPELSESMFVYTFANSESLSNIPALFSGFTTSAARAFQGTFSGCAALKSIPENLFGITDNPSEAMFAETFAGCTNITEIPEALFAQIGDAPDAYAFQNTFAATGITTIPSSLFANITTPSDNLFNGTFDSCEKLTTVPEELFQNITSPATGLFFGTFANTGLTTVPKLFTHMSGVPQQYMFSNTFSGSKINTSIPADLFGGLSGNPATGMMSSMFARTAATSYIPTILFANINNENYTAGPMSAIFADTQMWTECPTEMRQFITGFEVDFSGKVSCINCPAYSAQWSDDATWCQCFDGYSLDGTATGEIYTQTIDCQPIKYNAIYSCGAGTGAAPAGDQVMYGTEYTVAENTECIRNGYTFTGWETDVDDIMYDAGEVVTWNWKTDVTFTATWQQNAYTITFDKMGGTGGTDSVTVMYNELPPAIEVPTKDGYEFIGYYDEESIEQAAEFYDSVGTPLLKWSYASNGTLYAQYTPVTYKYTYECGKDGEGNPPVGGEVAFNAPFTTADSTCVAPTGYMFDKWVVSNTTDLLSAGETVAWPYTEDKILTATYAPITYTVTFYPNYDAATDDPVKRTFVYNIDYVLKQHFSRTGYDFVGYALTPDATADEIVYQVNDIVSNLTDTSDANIDLYSIWKSFSVKFEYNGNGGTQIVDPIEPSVCSGDDVCVAPENPYVRPGYKFTGWTCTGNAFCDSGLFSAGTDLRANIITSASDGDTIYMTAQWQPITFTVVYDVDAGAPEIETQTCTYDQDCFVSDVVPTKSGYEFENWGCASDDADSECNNNTLIAPSDNIRNITNVDNATVTLTANYTPTTYTVTYHANGGDGEMDASVFEMDIEYNLSLNTFERSGYTFMHWATNADGSGDIYTDGQTVMNLTDVKGGSVDLYAIWQSNTYTITLDPDGGITNQTSISVKHNDVVPNVQVPTRDDYLFMGYYTAKSGAGDKFFDKFGAPVSEIYTLTTDITVYAYWKVPTCTDYDGTVLDRCDDPILSVQEMIEDDVLEYKDTDSYKITNFDKYMRNQRWAVNFPTYGTGTGTITGSAFCGPANTAKYGTKVNGIKEYGSNQNDSIDTQANAGCWCQVGPTDTTKFWVAAGAYTDGATWAENTDACRANCPDFCAQLVATDSEFRTLLYDGEDACPIGTDYKKACCEGEYETAEGTYEDCPVGSWCNNCEINECDAIAMYTATQGATSPLACGTWLHVGDHTVFMRPNAKMTPIALHVNKRGTIFHANMSTEKPDDGKEKHLKAKVNDVIYYIYDNLLPI